MVLSTEAFEAVLQHMYTGSCSLSCTVAQTSEPHVVNLATSLELWIMGCIASSRQSSDLEGWSNSVAQNVIDIILFVFRLVPKRGPPAPGLHHQVCKRCKPWVDGVSLRQATEGLVRPV